jgi:hypothetical protein
VIGYATGIFFPFLLLLKRERNIFSFEGDKLCKCCKVGKASKSQFKDPELPSIIYIFSLFDATTVCIQASRVSSQLYSDNL